MSHVFALKFNFVLDFYIIYVGVQYSNPGQTNMCPDTSCACFVTASVAESIKEISKKWINGCT